MLPCRVLLFCLVVAEVLSVVLCRPVTGKLNQPRTFPGSVLLPHSFLELFRRAQSQPSAANCPAQPQPVPLPSPLPESVVNAFKELDSVASSTVDQTAVPGVIASVTYNGETLWTKGYGTKDKKTPEVPPDADNIFRIGSVSKIFPVLMLYQMYEAGLIKSLDDPLSTYNSNFSIRNPYSKEEITLRQMASQMSGLPREVPCGEVNSTVNLCPLNSSVILDRLSSQNLILPPWTKPSYSNLAYALLGRLLSQSVAGMEFEEYVQEKILTPLNLMNTGFKIDDRVKSRMAVGYEPDGSVAPLYDLGWESPAGQMYSTINDLNKLAQFFYNASISVGADIFAGQSLDEDDNILSSGLRREMQLPMYVNPDGLFGFGTPWEIAFVGNYTVRTKGGNVDGYSALFSFIPELKLSFNALFSGSFGETGFVVDAYNAFLPGLMAYLMENQPSAPQPPSTSLYEGVYNASGIVANIQVIKGMLTLIISSVGDQTVYLAYRRPYEMQIYYPESLLPCLTNELQASWEEWVYFDHDESGGMTTGFTIPGVVPALYWKREK